MQPGVRSWIYCLSLLLVSLVTETSIDRSVEAQPAGRGPATYLTFNGTSDFVEIPDSADFSVKFPGLTVMAWVSAQTFQFPSPVHVPDKLYAHWLGKGEADQEEWAFRIYRDDDPERPKRISFYIFNADGGRGCGSYFQDDIQPGEWVHVTGVIDTKQKTIAIYKNGRHRHTASWVDPETHKILIFPHDGSAPLRFGTRDKKSYLQGSIGHVLIWDRPLSQAEIQNYYQDFLLLPKNPGANYPLSEGTGTTAGDITPHHHNGAISGATWDKTYKGITKSLDSQAGGGC